MVITLLVYLFGFEMMQSKPACVLRHWSYRQRVFARKGLNFGMLALMEQRINLGQDPPCGQRRSLGHNAQPQT
jgi:hypothetical protein